MFTKKLNNFAIVCLCSISINSVAEEQVDSEDEKYTLKPVFLDGANDAGSTLGLEYGYADKWSAGLCKNDSGQSDTDSSSYPAPDDVRDELKDSDCFISLDLDGIWTSDENTNPKSFSQVAISIGYYKFLPAVQDDPGRELEFSAELSVEGNQDFSNRQEVIELNAGAFFNNGTGNHLNLEIAYGEIDASENEQRDAFTNDDTFNRFSAEVDINYRLDFIRQGRKYSPKAIRFNYRFFKEEDAPQSISDEGLDDFGRGTLYLKFENGFYAAYSEGELPFDLEKDEVFELGLTQNLF